jgi:hypothetical protein
MCIDIRCCLQLLVRWVKVMGRGTLLKSEIKLSEEEELTAEWLRYLYLKYDVGEKVKRGERPPKR